MKKILNIIIQFIVTKANYLYCKIIYGMKVEGKENIPLSGSIVFCGNHRSYLDVPLIITSCPRKMRFLAKEDLKKNWFLRILIYIYGAIYVKRDSKDIFALKEAIKELKNGGAIGLFPEGTRNGFEKNNGEIKAGAAYIALKTKSKVVPIGIKGKLKPFHRVKVIYGKAIDYSDRLNEKSIKELEVELTEDIKNSIISMI